jgi:hypothetical protein
VRLYPRAWRQRYGPEFNALLEQQPLTLRSVLDVARGALDAHWSAWRQQRSPEARMQPGRGKEYAVKRGQHEYRCSFCGKPQDMVHRIIAGPGSVYICNECIALCNEIIAEEEARLPPSVPPHKRSTTKHRTPRWWQRLHARRHRALPREYAGPRPVSS